ncbi:amino acid adenylation domain-containing protein [Xylariaceae sp. FL1272]|nr:amino acid adenylation domain-containing protein [Xylariaceae sp. FL1272]
MSLHSPAVSGLSILNPNPTRQDGPCLLHEIVSPTSRDGSSPAIDFLSGNGRQAKVSYQELHTASLNLASRISTKLDRSTVVAQGSPIIPILSSQSPQFYTAVLATLKASCAFCPLNVDAPVERIKFILDDVKAKVILATQDLSSRIPVGNGSYRVILIDNVLEDSSQLAHEQVLLQEPTPEGLAYVMYTSGSTGTPKGVAISHLAATQSILAHDPHLPTISRFLQFAAPTFDVSVFEIFFPLYRGATLVGCNRAEMLTDLPDVMRKLRVDACELTPSVAGSLLKKRENVPSLQVVLTIGEMLTDPVIQEFGGDEQKDSMLWGMYGPTEAAIHCTIEPKFASNSGRHVIGRPLETVSAFVIRMLDNISADPRFEILPVGEIGELALGGYQLATGYLNRPQQNATSFMESPYGRIYRTGDKARLRSDGVLECMGRIDDSQVKINGQRLELGEVEHVLLQTPGCHNAFATVISNTLVAFAAMEQDAVSSSPLLAQCKSWLPTFMIPTDIVAVEDFPQLPSGKVDKRQLVQNYENRAASVVHVEDEEDDQERILCETASLVLRQRISPSTVFAVARLDSLSAIEYASALREKGIPVHPVDVLSSNTPRDLRRKIKDFECPTSTSSHRLRRREEVNALLQKPKLKASLMEHVEEIDRLEPCSPLQLSMVAETLKDSRLYVNKAELHLAPGITADSFQKSFETLAQENEILRTGFSFIDGQLYQVIWKEFRCFQSNNKPGKAFQANEENIENFLLRPLTLEFRRQSSEATSLTVAITLHHAVYDGWTMDLVIEDLSLLLIGQTPAKRPQFYRVTTHFEGLDQSKDASAMEYWADHLRGAGSASMPNLRTTYEAKPHMRFATRELSLKPQAAEDLIRRALIGPQVLFQACIIWLLGALQGSDDVILGCVSSGRTLPIAGIERIMGPCMTTLPLRVRISQYKVISELLRSIHTINRETLGHGSLTLPHIRRAAGLSATSKIFDVIFAYQESLVSRRGSSTIVQEAWHCDITEAAMVIEIQPRRDSFVCQVNWQSGTIPEALVKTLMSHLDYLTNYFANHADASVESILSAFPTKHLSRFNDSPKRLETPTSLSEMVEISASRFAEVDALHFADAIGTSTFQGQSMTYHGLNSKANRIARHLQQQGADTGGIVAIIMSKSLLLYCTILAILKTGCAYLPILPSTPIERIEHILGQAQPQLCVVDEAAAAIGLDLAPERIVNIKAVDLSVYSANNIGILQEPSEIAYVIYTSLLSGTTGVPKGVSITHRNILSNIKVLSGIYPVEQPDRMLQACSQAFDVSVFEIFFAWANGMCLCAATNDTLFEDFERSVRALDVTHLSLTVTVASLLNPKNVPKVKFLVTSGEPMTDEVLEKWHLQLYQGYGPSETTNICTVRKVEKGDSSQFLGWAFENTSTLVFSPNSTDLVPIGCVGELCFGGDQVADGYLKLPEVTTSSFLEHPTYGRLYRSGDLGRMLPDGSLIIIGRIDNQVKLRGLRIELQEIQSIVLKTSIARTCTSIVVKLQSTSIQQLALFYVPFDIDDSRFAILPLTEKYKKDIQDLQQRLQASLPDYMLPTIIVPISSLPLTSSGKVDERSLHGEVEGLSASILSSYSLPEDQADIITEWSDLEISIANVLAKVLGLDILSLSPWTSFSALGIDSITAMPIARQLQATLRRRVHLTLLLQNQSIRRLASALTESEGASLSSVSTVPLLPADLTELIHKRLATRGRTIESILPCTPLQEAMIMSSSSVSSDGALSYYNQMLFQLHVSSDAMVEYWGRMFRRHQILRTCFVTSDNLQYATIQVVTEHNETPFYVPESGTGSLRTHALQHMASAKTLIERDQPPVSLAIIKTHDQGNYLSFICHHAMYDGISMQTMLSEIEAMHRGEHLQIPPPLEPFLRAVQQIPQQDNFWMEQFQGFVPTLLCGPEVKPDPLPRSFSLPISHMSLEAVKSKLQGLRVSMLAVCQAAWASTISIVTGNLDICFGNVVSGRSIALERIDQLVAPCFNTLPIRTKLSRTTFLIGLARNLQKLNTVMLPYQFTGLRKVQASLKSPTRLFDTLFILQPQPTIVDERIWSLANEEGIMDVPIVCEVVPSEFSNTAMVQLHRDPSLFSYQALELLGTLFCHMVDACLDSPYSHIPSSESLPLNWQKEIQVCFAYESSIVPSTTTETTSDVEKDWSTAEMKIRQVLAGLAGIPVPNIQRSVPIYRYGLDSIAAIQLAALLRREGFDVSAIDVIEHPSCAGIASILQTQKPKPFREPFNFARFRRETEADILRAGVETEAIETILPCTYTQQGLLSQFLESEGNLYFNYTSWEVKGIMEPEKMVKSWVELTAHHQILRTGFVPTNHPDSSFAMVVYKMHAISTPASLDLTNKFNIKQWRAQAVSNARRNLKQPPWEVIIVASKTGTEKVKITMHLAIHHALYDAFTLKLLLKSWSEIMKIDSRREDLSIQPALSHYFNMLRSSQSVGENFWRAKANGFATHRFPVLTPLHVHTDNTLSASIYCRKAASAIRQAAQGAGITVQAALQAAWSRLLTTYTGEAPVTFGVVFDGRTTTESRQATLPMIVTLPIIAEASTSDAELLQQMMQFNSECRRFQFMPMTQIQRFLGTTESPFDTILIYQAADTDRQPSLLEILEDIGSIEYPVSIEIEDEQSDKMRLNLTFKANVMPSEQASLLLEQFDHMLLSLLGFGEDVVPATTSLYSNLPPIHNHLAVEADLLHELTERSAYLRPTAVAFEFIHEITDTVKSQSWTYRQLDDLGNQVANFIIDQGVKPGSIIATCFNKCPIAYFAHLGILKAGCALLCLDASAPATRQKFILEDSSAAILLTEKLLDWMSGVALHVYHLDENEILSQPARLPILTRPLLSSDTCYCLYTSGTTGTPKGCLITHENAVQAMAAFKNLFTGHWDDSSRWLQFAAFHFDVSILEQYWSWYVGITVVAASKDLILSDLTGTISKLRITHIDLTPSLARLTSPEECPSLCKGIFITGGEKLRSDILHTWGSQRVIYNAYGPTEATIGVTMQLRVPENGRSSNIGNLFPNVGAYVFKPGTETLVLRGGVGELCVSGKLVGKGYLNRGGLTEERFPTLVTTGERIYRTGDLVRVLHDDSFDFIGRADDQVKLRGQRLEIGEINHAIRERLPEKFGDVCTLVTKRQDQDADILVSFIAIASRSNSNAQLQVYCGEDKLDLARIAQDACRDRLANYMVPTYILCVPYIPLSTNNKVDVNRLRALFSELSHEKLQVLAKPTTEIRRSLDASEDIVVRALSQVVRLKDQSITPTSTIFELGIDSITAGRLAKQLRIYGFPSASTSLLMRHPQIHQLSRALQQSNGMINYVLQMDQTIQALRHRFLGLVCSSLDLEADQVEYIAPCTALQEGILARSMAPESVFAYFVQFQLDLGPGVSVGRLQAALNHIVSSYSVLRTAFVETSEGYLQVAVKEKAVNWAEIKSDMDTFDKTIAGRHEQWARSRGQNLQFPFEVDCIECDGRHSLLLRLFHAIYDARSLQLILEYLKAEYQGIPFSTGPTFLPVLFQGPLTDHKISHAFWKSMLQDHRAQTMPRLTDQPNPNSAVVQRIITLYDLEATRKSLQVTHQTILQAAWLNTLRQYFLTPPTIGVVVSGRSLPIDDIDLVVGPLFNTLPLRTNFTEGMTWESQIGNIQELNNGVLTFAHTPLRDIQKLCTGGQPLFDTLFTFDADDSTTGDTEDDLWSLKETAGSPDYPLAIEIILVSQGAFKITLVAQSSIANDDNLEALLVQFTKSLRLLLASPESSIPLATSELAHTNPEVSFSSSHSDTNESVVTSLGTSATDFVWDEKASQIRQELATLAGVDDSKVTRLTNIFALGLDSIDVIKLSGRLKRLGYDVSMGAIMKNPSFENILSLLISTELDDEESIYSKDMTDTTAMLQDYFGQRPSALPDIHLILPPTPLQDSMMAEMMATEFDTYFNHDVLEIAPDVDLDRLKAALYTVYENSPILRTVFVEIDNPRIDCAYSQVIRTRELEIMPTTQMSTVDEVENIINRARSRALASQGLDYLFQVHFAESPTQRYLVLSIAHALYDGQSLQMLHEDIQAAYNGHFTSRPFYQSHLSHLIHQSTPRAMDFWAKLVHDVHPTILPPKFSNAEPGAVSWVERISKSSVATIRSLSKDYSVTPQVLIQGCWSAVLASLTKSLDVVFGVVLSGRNSEEAQQLMFPTMNTIALRTVLHGTVTTYLQYLQDIMSTVVTFQSTPLRDIQKASKIWGSPLFNTLFLLQSSERDRSHSDGFLTSTQSASKAEYPICVEMELTKTDAIWRVACDESYLSSRDAENLVAHLEAVLDHFSRQPRAQMLEADPTHSKKISICGLEPILLGGPSHTEPMSTEAVNPLLRESTSFPPANRDILLSVLSEISQVGKQEISIDQSIFHLGFDSISAIKASSILRKRGLQVSVRDLTTASSLRQILQQRHESVDKPVNGTSDITSDLESIVGREDIRTIIGRCNIKPESIETLLPAISLQIHMLSTWQESQGLVFFPTFGFKISSFVDKQIASRAWMSLIDDIAALRTYLVATNSVDVPFLQVILKPDARRELPMNVTESDGTWSIMHAATPFAAVRITGDQSGEVYLYLRIHHALYDAISLPLLLDRFVDRCGPSHQSPRPSDMAPWYNFVSTQLDPSTKTQRKSFWTSYLAGRVVSRRELPNAVNQDDQVKRTAEFRPQALDNTVNLRSMSSTYGISIQAVIFAVYAKFMAKRTHVSSSLDKGHDCVFGIYLSNRSSFPELADEPFPTLNILPLRVRNPVDRPIQILASEIQKDILEIGNRANSSVSLWELYQWTGLQIDTFVNFLPSTDDNAQDGEKMITLNKLPADDPLMSQYDELSAHVVRHDDKCVAPNLATNAYVESIDIEIAANGNGLDIGVFSSSRSLTSSQAQEIIESFAQELGGVLN